MVFRCFAFDCSKSSFTFTAVEKLYHYKQKLFPRQRSIFYIFVFLTFALTVLSASILFSQNLLSLSSRLPMSHIISSNYRQSPAIHTLLLDADGLISEIATTDTGGASLRRKLFARKYLFVTPRDDGFNNQRINLAEAFFCAAATGRVAVLPPIFSNSRYGTVPKGPYHFSDYFDMQALTQARIANFTTPDTLHATGIRCTIETQEGKPHRVLGALRSAYGWRRRDIRVGEKVGNPPCMSSRLCRIRYSGDTVFGPGNNYEKSGQGYSMDESKKFYRVRAALRPSSTVLAISREFRNAIPGPFNAVHLRRSDYKDKCKQMKAVCEKFGADSMYTTSKSVVVKVLNLENPNLPLFVATEDCAWVRRELRPLFDTFNVSVYLAQEVELPSNLQIYADRVDLISFATQVVAGDAEEFVGNRFSSFSTEISNERVLNGVNASKKFF